jgi:rubrerythrin
VRSGPGSGPLDGPKNNLREETVIENLTIEKALGFAIETEQIGQEMYQKLARRHADDSELRGLFARLAEDEKLHEAQLRELRKELSRSGTGELSDEDSEYLRRMSTTEVFYGISDPLAAVEDGPGRQDALKLAHDLEKSTLVYYDAMKDVLGDNEVLERIIAMEKQHLRQVLKYMMAPDSKMRGVSDEWT